MRKYLSPIFFALALAQSASATQDPGAVSAALNVSIETERRAIEQKVDISGCTLSVTSEMTHISPNRSRTYLLRGEINLIRYFIRDEIEESPIADRIILTKLKAKDPTLTKEQQKFLLLYLTTIGDPQKARDLHRRVRDGEFGNDALPDWASEEKIGGDGADFYTFRPAANLALRVKKGDGAQVVKALAAFMKSNCPNG